MCQLVCLRSARLCAAAIAGILQRAGHPCGGASASGGAASAPAPHVVVAVDGSVFAKYSKYRCGGGGGRTLPGWSNTVRGWVGVAAVVRQHGWLAQGPQTRQARLTNQPLFGSPATFVNRERLRAALEDVCGKAAADSIELRLAQDGSVLGAAYLAIAAAQFGQAGDAA